GTACPELHQATLARSKWGWPMCRVKHIGPSSVNPTPGTPAQSASFLLLWSLVGPDGVPQAETGPGVGYQSAQVPLGLPEPVLNAAQPGTFGKPLLVEHPFASGREPALRRGQHRLAEVRQAGDPVQAPGVDLGEVQSASGEPEPGSRR